MSEADKSQGRRSHLPPDLKKARSLPFNHPALEFPDRHNAFLQTGYRLEIIGFRETSLSYDRLIAIYQKRWNVEVIHKSPKQNAAFEKSPTKVIRGLVNHIFGAMVTA
ncbi:MAG: hypothetical protein U0401_10370 [Anaerolineae bacterium]